MMQLWESIVLGVIQGLTEFLPISSSGHLVVAQSLMSLTSDDVVFEVAVHLGTLLSIFTIYFKLIKEILIDLLKLPIQRSVNANVRLVYLIFIGSLPTAIIGLGFKDQFEALFSSTQSVGILLCITGLFLFFTDYKSKGGASSKLIDIEEVSKISTLQAFIIGLLQGCAIAPGISRSGATIATGIYLGIDRNAAATYSFLLSVPAILGACLLQAQKLTTFDLNSMLVIGVGVVTAYLAGLAGLWGILHVVRIGRLRMFSIYLWVLGPLVYFLL